MASSESCADLNYLTFHLNINLGTLKESHESLAEVKKLFMFFTSLVNSSFCYYRTSEEHDKIRACDGSTSHEKYVCYLNVNNLNFGIYVLVETETGRNTLKPKFGWCYF